MERLCVGVLLAIALYPGGSAAYYPLEGFVRLSDGTGGLTSLGGVHDLVISPDGDFVYATSPVEDGIQVLAREPASGALGFLDVETDEVAGVEGLNGAGRPALDATGTHLYVPGRDDDALAVFSRDAGTGFFPHIGFLEVQVNGVAGVTGLDAPRVAVVGPDGEQVYVGAANGRIAIFARDSATGALDFTSAFVEAGTSGSFQALAFGPGGNQLYAGTGNGEVFVYPRTPATGALGAGTEITNGVAGTTGLGDVQQIAVTTDGQDVYVASLSGNAVLFSRNTGTGALAFVSVASIFCDSIAITANGRRVYCGANNQAVSGGLYQVFAYDRDPDSGALAQVGALSIGDFDAFDSPTHGGLVLSPDGAHLYGAWSGENAIASAAVAPFDPVEEEIDGVGGVDGVAGASSVAVSPDGRSVYATGYDDDAVAAFSRNPATSALTFVEREKNGEGSVAGLDTASAVRVSPDGRHVYAAGDLAASLVVFSRDAATGALTFVERRQNGVGPIVGLNRPVGIAISADGRHVYGISTTGAVAAFSRNATSGALAFVEAEFDGSAGVDGLAGATALALSPDGAHLYAAGTSESEIAIFARDAASGALTFEAVVTAAAAPGLESPRSVVVSHDGAHVYVSAGAESILGFLRDRATGLLLHQQTLVVNQPPFVPRLTFPEEIAITSDGRFLVAAGFTSDTLVAFRRDRETGAIGMTQIEYDDFQLALDGAVAVATAPDGAVYAASDVSGSIAAFAPEPGALASALAALAALARRRARR